MTCSFYKEHFLFAYTCILVYNFFVFWGGKGSMNKKIITVLLCIFMLMSFCIPITADRTVVDYELFLLNGNGFYYEDGNQYPVTVDLSSMGITYSNSTYYFDGVDFVTSAERAMTIKDLNPTIELINNGSYVESASNKEANNPVGIECEGNLTIRGDQDLHIVSGGMNTSGTGIGVPDSTGLLVTENLYVYGGNLTCLGGNTFGFSDGINVLGDSYIEGGNVTVIGGIASNSTGFRCSGNLTIRGGRLSCLSSCEDGNSYGASVSPYSESGSIRITGGEAYFMGVTNVFENISSPITLDDSGYSSMMVYGGENEDSSSMLTSWKGNGEDDLEGVSYLFLRPKREVEAFVERLYTVSLGRAPEEEGMINWTNALYSHEETGGALGRFFCTSQEMVNRNLSNEEYLNVLYYTFFDRTPDALGFSDWLTRLNSGASRDSILDGFINSVEWANVCARFGIDSGGLALSDIEPTENVLDFTRRLYNKCLGREGDQEGLMKWGKELANRRQSATNVAYGFFFSSEFINANHSNEEYIDRLYETFIGREADREGKEYWLSRINSGATREEIFYGFANSEEFHNICEIYGIYN